MEIAMATMIKMIKLQLALGLLEIISVLCTCNATYTPADKYFISCGSSIDANIGRRVFLADNSRSVTLTAPQSIAGSTSRNSASGFNDYAAALYQTARIFTSPSSYSLKIKNRGRHFVRLYFFPFVYKSYDLTTATFKVSTQDVVLLDNFRPARNASPIEFLLNITRDTLIITFVPLGSLAFVNAIEVVSVPDNLIVDRSRTMNPDVQLLQTAYRINVGGPDVPPDNDTLWRAWDTDQHFLQPGMTQTEEVNYTGELNHLPGQATQDDAPDVVYATARELVMLRLPNSSDLMVWQFLVDHDSSYLIRFHFCNIVRMAPHQVRINVFVDAHAAVHDLDLSTIGNGALAFPNYKDFVLPSSDPTGKLTVYVGSGSPKNTPSAAILNGLEIMKLIFITGSVVVVEPPAAAEKWHLAVIVGSACGCFALVAMAVLFVIVVFRKKEKTPPPPTPPQSGSSTPLVPLLSRLSFRGLGTASLFSSTIVTPGARPIVTPIRPSYRVPFTTLQEATNNFNESLVVGEGGFGKVYKGVLPDGTKVAAKRASPESRQGAKEFLNEIKLLSGLRHRHLVSLIGYCDEHEEMILLYEYMEKGSLRSHLYGTDQRALSWKERLVVCIGAAQGLVYLHTAVAKPVIHRDVKSSNILLDESLTAKVSDFGLSRTGPELDETHVSTTVKGSYGYVDPEYVQKKRLTCKSDVYSFGVVMLEVLCARPVIDPSLPRAMANLADVGLRWQKRGELEKVVDRRIAATVAPMALRKYGQTVEKCLAERGADRPAMEDVVWYLQLVLRLQEPDESVSSGVNSIIPASELMQSSTSQWSSLEIGSECEDRDGEGDAEDVDMSMRGIFWKMVNVKDSGEGSMALHKFT